MTWGKIGNLKGPKGTDGTNGKDGTNGQNGTNGSSFLSGHGAPASTVGKAGDTYLDVDSGDVYQLS